MNSKLLFFIIGNLFILFNAQAQCIDTLPANTVIITSDTLISNAVGTNNYLICPGVNVTYNGGQSTFNNYYLEDSASVEFGAYHYPQVHVKPNAEVIANHSITPPPSMIMNSTAEYGAIFTDTLDSYTDITWCSNLVFNYSNLPGGVGCPQNNPCIEVLPSNTVIITSDTIISNANGMNNYLICPSVNVTYNGGQSNFNNYYLEDSASIEFGTYHYPQVHVQSSAEVIANHSTSPQSLLMNSSAEYGAIFTDTTDTYTGNITWCSNLIFDYSNLPNGVGCPTVTNVAKVSHSTIAHIYPNPADNFIVIDFEQHHTDYTLLLTNSLGQVVHRASTNGKKHILNLEKNMEKGFYILSILDKKNRLIQSQKIMLH